MTRPLPEEERIARDRARKRAWWDAHPDYRAEHRKKNLERLREQNRNYMRAQAAEKKRREREVERVREWSKQNPDKRKAARERYKAANPEKYREAQRAYYHRNKEAIQARRDAARTPDKVRADARRDNEKRDRAKPAKPPSPEQRERYQAQQRDKKRVERALAKAGLPSRRIRRVLAFEKRRNAAEADAFFARRRSYVELTRIRRQDEPTPPELISQWNDGAARLRDRLRFRRAVDVYQFEHAERLHEEVILDSRARELVCKLPYDVLLEVRRRAVAEVREGQARKEVSGRVLEAHRSGAVVTAGSVRELVQANVRAGWRIVPAPTGVAPQQLLLVSDEYGDARLLTIGPAGVEVREFGTAAGRSAHIQALYGGIGSVPSAPALGPTAPLTGERPTMFAAVDASTVVARR
ncbi:hypothetical protein [Agromyces mariniharenae]|uniref:Uncharacterized protein n=1 Tax=Agromyces mariniharenae TaxID=2604423 RepID=A0A5S4UV73_9MICO|nr:hypothetical protein [Agromyces mariniharenae]TYL50432.1 hypothetical protein FYC51_14590 [Agromyces mariniharenae]